MTNPKPKNPRQRNRKPDANPIGTDSEQVQAAMLAEALSGNAAAAKIYLRNERGGSAKGRPSLDIEAWTAHIGTPWEDVLPDNRHLLNPEQRAIVDAAIEEKRKVIAVKEK